MKSQGISTHTGGQGSQNQAAFNQKLLDFSMDIICTIDAEGRFLTLSAAAKAIWGYEPAELEGQYYIDYVVEADKAFTAQAAIAIMAGEATTSFENHYQCKDGTIKPMLWSARWDSKESIYYCIAKDATAIKAIEEKNRIQEKRLMRAYKLTGIAWWEYDVATQTYTSSDELFHMYGLPISENNQTTLQEFLSYVHPEDVPKLYEDLSTILQDTYVNYEHRVIKPNGDVIHVIHYSEVIRDLNGNPMSIHGTARDITERKTQQLQLERSEKEALEKSKQLNDILENLGDGFFTVDKTWRVTYWNQKAEVILSKKRTEIIGQNLWEVYREAVSLKFYSEYHRALDNQINVHFEEYFPQLKIWFDVAVYPNQEGLAIFFKDITDKKAAEIEIERLSLVAKETASVVIITDAEERIIWVNQAFTTNTEYSFEEAIGIKCGALLQGPKTSVKTKAYLREQIQKGLPFECEIINYSKSGREYWIEIKGQPLLNAAGKVEQFFAIQTDITERVELQKMVLEEKIGAQKEVAKAIIQTQEKERSEISKELHDNVNQLLTTVKLYIENIKELPEHKDTFINKSIDLTQKAINEVRMLAKQLVTPVITDLGFRTTIKELIAHFKSLNTFDVQLQLDVDEKQLVTEMQMTIYRILQEQLNNIVKYAKASLVNIEIVKHLNSVSVLIKDNGVGFEPSKVSTGLGLNNIKNRAEVYKGKVSLESALGEGCSLHIIFPI